MSLLAPIVAAVICFGDGACKPPAHLHPPRMQTALASWYDDAGTTASGAHLPLGFASLLFASQWGRRVRFCYRGRCAIGRLDDHGPYVTGRLFDLGPALKATLACPDLCWLTWRAA
jgi:hypothetical protein